MARNIKDSFVDGLLQIAIFLSLLRTNWRELTTSSGLSDQFRSHESDWGQLEVSRISNTYNNERWNPMLGISVHPKHVENDRVEDVLRRVHSLAGYRSFGHLTTRIDAFLLEEGAEAGLSGLHVGLRVDAINNQASNLNPRISAEEPSKDDMDLIDVLWRQDIDLAGVEDVTLLRELEKSEEMRLHDKQEEETIEQLIHTFDFSQQLNHSGPASNNSLNTPEVQLDPLTPNFQVFSSFLNDTDESMPLQWNDITSSSSPPNQQFLHAVNNDYLYNHTSTNHSRGPDVSTTSTLHPMGRVGLLGNFSMYRDVDVDHLENNISILNNNNTVVSTSNSNNFLSTDYNVGEGGVTSHQGNPPIHGVLNDVSFSTQQDFFPPATTNNLSTLQHTSLQTTPSNNNHKLNNNNNKINNNNNVDDDLLGALMNEDHLNEQFGSLENVLGMEDFASDLRLQQAQPQQQQLSLEDVELPLQSLLTTPLISPSSPLLPVNNNDDSKVANYNASVVANNNTNHINNIDLNDISLFDSTFSDDFLLTELTDDSTFMEFLSATDQFGLMADEHSVSSDSALSSMLDAVERPSGGTFKTEPSLHEVFDAMPHHAQPSPYVTPSSTFSQDFYRDLDVANRSSSARSSLQSVAHSHTLLNVSTTNSTTPDHRIPTPHDHHFSTTPNHSFSATYDHNYCLPSHVACIKPDPDTIPSCSHSLPPTNQPSLEASSTLDTGFLPFIPVRKSTRKSTLKHESNDNYDEDDDEDDELINPGGEDDDDDDDEYKVDDEDDYAYSNKSKKNVYSFKYSTKLKKSPQSSSSSSRGKDELKAMQLAIPFEVEEIIHCQAERFNEMVTSRHLSTEQVQLIKDIRKRGKNKLAAQNCRKRKLDVISALEEELEGLREQRQAEVLKRHKALSSLEEMKRQVASLQDQILSSLRDSRRPQHFNVAPVQQNLPASVLLLPRDNSTDQSGNKMKRKRK